MVTNEAQILLESLYRLDVDDHEYLRLLHDAFLRLGVAEGPAVAVCWRASSHNVAELDGFHTEVPELAAIHDQITAAASPAMRLRFLRERPTFDLMSNVFTGTRALRQSSSLGVPDFVGLFAPTGTGFTIVVGAPLFTCPSARLPRLPGLAEHLAAAWRLRKRLAEPDAFGDNAEAVLRPDGAVQAVHGVTQNRLERLRRVVLARERAMKAADGTLWPALLDGRFTIVDRFETNGDRYVVAYRNSRGASEPVALGATERAILEAVSAGTMEKVVALELGMSASRVSAVLRGALRKVGLASAIELTLLASSGSFVVLDDEVLGPSIVQAFALQRTEADALSSLTATERAITADLLRGFGNREIAARRNRSERTVANQVASILSKLHVTSRRGLAAKLAPRT